jgi:hypothetical protein
MVKVCAWCEKYMGSREPLHNPGVSHGICDECVERETLGGAPVLVVSRDRSGAIPMLQTLLRGAPEIAIVVDRRSEERRRTNGRGNGHGRPIAWVSDRRDATDRRRRPSFYLV